VNGHDRLCTLLRAACVYETADIALGAPEVQALMRELRPLVERDEAREMAKEMFLRFCAAIKQCYPQPSNEDWTFQSVAADMYEISTYALSGLDDGRKQNTTASDDAQTADAISAWNEVAGLRAEVERLRFAQRLGETLRGNLGLKIADLEEHSKRSWMGLEVAIAERDEARAEVERLKAEAAAQRAKSSEVRRAATAQPVGRAAMTTLGGPLRDPT
jgi:hypothetical protein